ncbi:MAG: hypothetical protein ACYCXX_01910 [Acidiferrobacter thiooxydans]
MHARSAPLNYPGSPLAGSCPDPPHRPDQSVGGCAGAGVSGPPGGCASWPSPGARRTVVAESALSWIA